VHDRRRWRFVFWGGGGIECERLYDIKDGLFIRHDRIEINEDITGESIGL
jgi:hypothetical protein